ncbi:hypothetical protein F4802DRAFT_617625 [Xylaria palmicola]|nr:hypothetical protein F4802DRAFT_617625 [Xylaria palmicola]
MSDQRTQELQPPSPGEINKLRDELCSLKLNGICDWLDDNAIEELLHLPSSLFFEAVRNVVAAFGPLSSIPASKYPIAATTAHEELESKQLNAIIDDGDSFLDEALDALAGYNKLLEDKVAKFSVQSSRSLATLRESSAVDNDITALLEKTAETKQRRLHHAQQIAVLRNSFNAHITKSSLRLDEYSPSFWNDVLLLNRHDTFLANGHRLAQEMAPPETLWDEYDYMLRQVGRWKSLVSDDSHDGEAIIERAHQHVSQLVYSITCHCQAQLAIVFHESLAATVAKADHLRAIHDEAADIVKEIDWLWEEVIPVAHMSVSAQFLRPVLKRFEDWKSSKQAREAIVTTYASGVLKFMNDRLSAVAERTRTLVHHNKALNDVTRISQQNVASKTADNASEPMSHTLALSTQPQRQNTKASKNLQAFMEMYGAVPVHTDGPSPKPTAPLLDEYVQNRAHKGDILLQDLHKLFETTAKSTLTDQTLGGELLLESLLADSAASRAQPGSVYKDTQLEGSIAMLQGQARQIQEIFADLKLEGPMSAPDYVAHSHRRVVDCLAAKTGQGQFGAGENPNPKLEDFVRKWGC